MKFRLTYDIVTEESATHGDFAFNGFVTRNGGTPRRRNYIPKAPAEFRLREAINLLLDRESHGPIEADSCPVSLQCPPRWFTCYGVRDNCGECTSFSLHLPKTTSPSSALRVARLLKCYGLRKSPVC